jgi:hypothetical protein
MKAVFSFPRRSHDEGSAEAEAVRRIARHATPRGDAHLDLADFDACAETCA